MTIPLIKIKVLPKPVLKGKMDVRFPARVVAQSPILLNNSNGTYTFSLDVNTLASTFVTFFEPIHSYINQEITAGASAAVATNAKTVRVNKTVGSATTIQMPLAVTMLPEFILVADWKGDAGTNNITILPSGTEKIQGLSSWVIAADNGSICLRPIPGVGFAI